MLGHPPALRRPRELRIGPDGADGPQRSPRYGNDDLLCPRCTTMFSYDWDTDNGKAAVTASHEGAVGMRAVFLSSTRAENPT